MVGVPRTTLRYKSRRPMQEALRTRLRELAATHVRYGYRRLTVLLRREGRSLAWDPEKQLVVGDSEANALLRQEYRAPYRHPEA